MLDIGDADEMREVDVKGIGGGVHSRVGAVFSRRVLLEEGI